MFIRVFDKNLCGIIDNKQIVFTKNSKNNALHFTFTGKDFEDIKLFEENVLIKKIPKTQTKGVDMLPFYSILFEDKSLFIFQPMSACNTLVLDEDSENLKRKDITSLTEGDSVIFYDEEFDDFIIKEVQDINVFDAVEDQFVDDEEDIGFSGYVVGAENPNGLILNGLLLV